MPAPLRIIIEEDPQHPEIARIPWELAYANERFLATDPFTPIIRKPVNTRWVNSLKLQSPLRMALISASPKDQQPLMVEEELINFALSLDEPMSSGRLVVDEIMNCTRENLRETLRGNRYDIIYFTGHGSFQDGTGVIALEKPDGSTDSISADDFASVVRSQREVGLLFLNCCNAGSVGKVRSEGWEGFGDAARKAMRNGLPEVVATQSAIFDSTGRKVMKTFFAELCRDDRFDVASALAEARASVENDQRQFHDFYHFIHLSALKENVNPEVTKIQLNEVNRLGWEKEVIFHTPNRMEIGQGFVGRFSYLSRLEEALWTDGTKIIGIHGLGGIGKTFLCARMEQRALTHHIQAKRLKKSIWIDFREGTGNTLSGLLQQLDNIARDLGFATFNKVLDDQETYPTPLEKLRPWFKHLDNTCNGKALLILDNLESALDDEGRFKDAEMQAWFTELLVRSPGWKVLVTCRRRFEFFPDGRELAPSCWIHLNQMGITERLAMLNRKADLRNRPENEKRDILKASGGHPYVINLIAGYLSIHHDLPEALREANANTTEYARLDWFLSLLNDEERDWLLILVLFPPPIPERFIILSRLIRDQKEEDDIGTIERSYHTAVRRITELSLIETGEGSTQVHPLIAYQLLENSESKFHQTEEVIEATRRAIAIVYLETSGKLNRPDKAMLLLQGINPLLTQTDISLMNYYLQECADVFMGFVPASVFTDIVQRAEGPLFEEASEFSLNTLCFYAQTLSSMRHFNAATDILARLLNHEKLLVSKKSKFIGTLGNIYLAQRNWVKALENYKMALECEEKSGQHHEMGSFYHQIGMVYEEQRDWMKALENYQIALECKEKNDQHHEMGSTYHQIGMVYQAQRNWSKALESYHDALKCKEKNGQHHEIGSTYHQIGRVYEEQRDWVKALENYKMALECEEKSGQHHEIGSSYHQIGMVYQAQRNWVKALENYQNALEWNEKSGQHHMMGDTYHQIGRAYQEQHDWVKALKNYQNALEWKEKNGQHHRLGNTYHQIGRVYQEQRDWVKALKNYQNALEWNEESGQHHWLGNTYHQIGIVYEEQRNWVKALECYKDALEWKEKSGQHHEMGSTYHQIGMVYKKQGDFPEALKQYLKALNICVENGMTDGVELILSSLQRLFPNLSSEEKAALLESIPKELHEIFKSEENNNS